MQAEPPDGVENSTQPTLAGNTRESIFLFVQNLIGMFVKLLDKELILTNKSSLHSSHPRHSLSLLHASPPSPL
jgi:hypothetical protein